MDQALAGIRVVDFSTGAAGPFCTKLLADFGAEVIKVEPASGDPARHHPPFAQDIPGPERSLFFLNLNTNKRSTTINPETEAGVELLRRLCAESHVLVEDFEPGALASVGLGYAELAAEQPDLVYASITPWGQSGPYVDMGLRASELTLQGMGGPVIGTGTEEREPLKLAGYLASQQAGAALAYMIVAAVLRAEDGGGGDHIDVSIYETQLGSRDRRTPALTTHAYQGSTSRRVHSGIGLAQGVQPCADGYMNLIAIGPKAHKWVEMIGRPDLVGDPRMNQPPTTLDPAFVEELHAAYLAWSVGKTKREAVAEAQSYGLLAGIVNTPEDLITDPHYRERGEWETIDHPATGPAEYPGRPFIMSESPRQPARRAPLLGEHNVEVLTEILGVPAEEIPTLAGLDVI